MRPLKPPDSLKKLELLQSRRPHAPLDKLSALRKNASLRKRPLKK